MQSRRRLFVASIALGGVLGGCAPARTDPEVLEGDFTVLAALVRPGEFVAYHLRTDAGDIFDLEFAAPPEVEPNSRVTVTGESLDGDRFRVASIEQLEASRDLGMIRQALGQPWSRRTAVVLMNFRNNQAQPISVEDARKLYFEGPTSVAAYFQEESYGLTTMSGDVFGYITVDFDDTACDVDRWADDVKQRLREQGVDPDSYDHLSLYFPNNPNCGFAGLGHQPGPNTWINQSDGSTIAHELGHNFGESHAATNPCTGASVHGSDCRWDEYGDLYDVMGGGWDMFHGCAYHKGQLGWFGPENTATATATALFEVAPIELPSDGVLSLRVAIPGSQDFYYAEYRRASGFDHYRDSSGFFEGLLIHRAPDYAQGTTPVLIDTVPETADIWDAWLGDGRTFRDDRAGISISLLSHTQDAATVRVQIGEDCGECGCTLPYPDADADGAPDCSEECDADPAKTAPGSCGCGSPDSDRDADGSLDCQDQCPDDPTATSEPCAPSGDGDGDGDRPSTDDDDSPAIDESDNTETEQHPVSEAPVSNVVRGSTCQLAPGARGPLPLLALLAGLALLRRRRDI
jgi:hypothetical protein